MNIKDVIKRIQNVSQEEAETVLNRFTSTIVMDALSGQRDRKKFNCFISVDTKEAFIAGLETALAEMKNIDEDESISLLEYVNKYGSLSMGYQKNIV